MQVFASLITIVVCFATYWAVAAVRARARMEVIQESVRHEQERLDAILDGQDPDVVGPRIGSPRVERSPSRHPTFHVPT